MSLDNEEVNAIVFLGCMLTIVTCSATLLYYRTSCMLDPVTLREILKTRRDMANRYGQPNYRARQMIRSPRHRQTLDVIRVKHIRTQYEVLTEDDN